MLGDRLLLALVNLWVYLRHLRHIRRFQWIVGYTPNTALPRRYHEKMLWRKVFDRNPRFVEFSDKLRCKAYALARCPDLAQPATLWQGERTAEIPADLMTGPTYLKANHGWKLNRRLDAGSRPDDIPPELGQHWLSRQHGEKRFEWAYLQVAPRLYLEEALQSTDAEPLVDLSVHAVAGDAVIVEIETGTKTANSRKGYFHPCGKRWRAIENADDWKAGKALPLDHSAPGCLAFALACTQRLGRDVDYARFDFLVVGERLFAGEITVYPGGGLDNATKFAAYNDALNPGWDLRQSWFLSTPTRGWRECYRRALARQLGD